MDNLDPAAHEAFDATEAFETADLPATLADGTFTAALLTEVWGPRLPASTTLRARRIYADISDTPRGRRIPLHAVRAA